MQGMRPPRGLLPSVLHLSLLPSPQHLHTQSGTSLLSLETPSERGGRGGKPRLGHVTQRGSFSKGMEYIMGAPMEITLPGTWSMEKEEKGLWSIGDQHRSFWKRRQGIHGTLLGRGTIVPIS